MRAVRMSMPTIVERPEVDDAAPANGPMWIVTVYDNAYNTYDEVITILMLATGCDLEEASIETWEIDHLGRSVVHHGTIEVCLGAAEIIAQIGIRVEVTEEA
jgi:ATP-dependent Clp protease adapter protein ClpS